jgi:cytoskeletal protein CcmA (bactofilin family)
MAKISSYGNVKSDETTIIGRSVRIEGTVSSDGNISVDGRIKGEVFCQNNVNVSESGHVVGKINASEVVIGGRVEGSVNAKEKLTLEPQANVKGDILTKTLVVESGAKLDGNVKMENSRYTPEVTPVGKIETPQVK